MCGTTSCASTDMSSTKFASLETRRPHSASVDAWRTGSRLSRRSRSSNPLTIPTWIPLVLSGLRAENNMPESASVETSTAPTTEQAKPLDALRVREKVERYVRLDWKPDGRHDILVVGMTKPSELRVLLEFGLRHIRACLFRGRPITSPPQVASQKREGDDT